MLIPQTLTRLIPGSFGVLEHLPFVPKVVTAILVGVLANATAPRPRPFTLASDYTSWLSLTDRTFTGRHLPAAVPGTVKLPSETAVKELFRREPDREIPS